MPPQVGFGGGGPRPRKLSDDSTMIATPRLAVDSTMIGAQAFGKIYRAMIRRFEHPITRAAST